MFSYVWQSDIQTLAVWIVLQDVSWAADEAELERPTFSRGYSAWNQSYRVPMYSVQARVGTISPLIVTQSRLAGFMRDCIIA